jgi:hypothetical protein
MAKGYKCSCQSSRELPNYAAPPPPARAEGVMLALSPRRATPHYNSRLVFKPEKSSQYPLERFARQDLLQGKSLALR